MPELAALAANSPFFEGDDSGLASARLKLVEDLSRAATPPAFATWRELGRVPRVGRPRRALARPLVSLVGSPSSARPRHDRVSVRGLADVRRAQRRARRRLPVARRRPATAPARGRAARVHATHVIAENRWRAVRDGLDAVLVDADTGRAEPVRARLSRLLLELEPYAVELGCSAELDEAWPMLGQERSRAPARHRAHPRRRRPRGVARRRDRRRPLDPRAAAKLRVFPGGSPRGHPRRRSLPSRLRSAMAPRESRAPHPPPKRGTSTSLPQATRARAVFPIRRIRSCGIALPYHSRSGRSCRCRRHHGAKASFDPVAFVASPLVAHPGALHPPARIDRLAPHDRLARPSFRQPRRHADQRRHLGAPGPRRASRASRPRRRPHEQLVVAYRIWTRERAPLRRRPVAALLVRLRRRLT